MNLIKIVSSTNYADQNDDAITLVALKTLCETFRIFFSWQRKKLLILVGT